MLIDSEKLWKKIEPLMTNMKVSRQVKSVILEMEKNPAKIEFEEMTIEQLDLSMRAYNCMKRANVDKVYKIASMTFWQLLEQRNVGQMTVMEIICALMRAERERERGDLNADDPCARRG